MFLITSSVRGPGRGGDGDGTGTGCLGSPEPRRRPSITPPRCSAQVYVRPVQFFCGTPIYQGANSCLIQYVNCLLFILHRNCFPSRRQTIDLSARTPPPRPAPPGPGTNLAVASGASPPFLPPSVLPPASSYVSLRRPPVALGRGRPRPAPHLPPPPRFT